MIAHKHITKIIAVVMAVAACLCLCAVAFSGEIAAAMGYQNPSKFTEAFFSVMGKKPLEYRKQHEKS